LEATHTSVDSFLREYHDLMVHESCLVVTVGQNDLC